MLNSSLNKLGRYTQPHLIGQNWFLSGFRAKTSHLIRRHAWVFLATTTMTLTLAILYVSVAPRVYTAHAQLFLDPRNPQPIGGEDKEMMVALDSPEVESQITILRSGQVLAAVATALKLYDDPEFASGGNGKDALTTELSKNPDSVNMLAAIDSLQAGLDVRRVGLSHTLDVYFSCRDPEKAAKIANAVAKSYVKDQLTTRSSVASQGTTWLEERIEQLRQQVNATVLKAQEFRAKRDYRIQEPHGSNEGGASAVRSQQITLDELESTAATYRKLYESYLQAYTTSVQRQALPASMARVITRASATLVPSHPRTRMLLGVSILLGLLIGYGIALIRELFDKSIKRPLEVQKAGLNWLGELYGLNPATYEAGGASGFNWTQDYFRKREVECIPNGVRMVFDEPLSQFSLGIRTLESQMAFLTKGKTFRHFGVTPAAFIQRTAEITCNLAYLSSIKGKRVLLVDANVSTPTLTRELAPDQNWPSGRIVR